MAPKLPFSLHVSSQLGFPICGDDYVQYSAPHVIKLEIGNLIEIPLGITMTACDPRGKLIVGLDDKYADSIKLTKNIFSPNHKLPLVIRLCNKSDTYIRINPSEKVFKYKWIPTKAPISAEIGTDTEKIITIDQETQTKIPAVANPVIEEEIVEEPVVEEEIVEEETVEESIVVPVATILATESVVDPVATIVATPATLVATKKLGKRLKKRVNV